jgi:type I restriction enzyme S subunit
MAINLKEHRLPPGWAICWLPEFSRIVMGQSPSSETYNHQKVGLPFFQGKAEFGEIYPKIDKYCYEPIKIAEAGAILLSVRAPVGPTNLAKEKSCIGRGLAAIHPLGGIDPKFALFLFRSIEPDISDKGTGSTFKAITKAFVEELEFGLPPLNEQRRIVTKLEELFSELDKGIENLKTARAQLKVYRQAVLNHAFEGKLTAKWREENKDKLESPQQLLARIQQERESRYQQQLEEWEAAVKAWEADGKVRKKPRKPQCSKPTPPVSVEEAVDLCKLPHGWLWIRPKDIASPTPHSIGIGPFGSNLKVSDYRDAGVPLIFVRNITRSNFSLDRKFIDPDKAEELIAHSVKPLDILITKMGDPPGDCEIYPEDAVPAVLTADCLKFRVWASFVDREFFKYCIWSNYVKRQLGLITKGVAQKKNQC